MDDRLRSHLQEATQLLSVSPEVGSDQIFRVSNIGRRNSLVDDLFQLGEVGSASV